MWVVLCGWYCVGGIVWVVLCVLTAAKDQKSELFVYVYSTRLQQNLRTSPDFTCFFRFSCQRG